MFSSIRLTAIPGQADEQSGLLGEVVDDHGSPERADVGFGAARKPALLPCSTVYCLTLQPYGASPSDPTDKAGSRHVHFRRPAPKFTRTLLVCWVTGRPNCSQRDAADQSFAATLGDGQHSAPAGLASRGGVSARLPPAPILHLSLGNGAHESLGAQCFPGKCHEPPGQSNVPVSLPECYIDKRREPSAVDQLIGLAFAHHPTFPHSPDDFRPPRTRLTAFFSTPSHSC